MSQRWQKTLLPDPAATVEEHRFAAYVRTLGRGPGRSRALTRDEARDALSMVLQGDADPHQVGAFLMLLRYRGEDAAEMAGLVDAAREHMGAGLPPGTAPVDLDWPSYGAGRTRGAPWFLLAALALARAGHRVLMHGTNEFSRAMTVPEGLDELGLRPAMDRADAVIQLDRMGFAYLPLQTLSPALNALLGLRYLLGLRSPLNTAARLLNPFDARAGVDGVFHPAYIALHLAAAERLGRQRLVVVKGGGGEAERTPAKAMTAHWFDRAHGTAETTLPQLPVEPLLDTGLTQVWHDGVGRGASIAIATVALGLIALGEASDVAEMHAAEVWSRRHG